MRETQQPNYSCQFFGKLVKIVNYYSRVTFFKKNLQRVNLLVNKPSAEVTESHLLTLTKSSRIETGVTTTPHCIVLPHPLCIHRLQEYNFNENEEMKLRNHFKKKLNYFCSLLRLPNVVQIISQAFNKIVVASFSFFLSTASSRLIRVLTLISLLFHSFNSDELSFSSSSSNALILSSNVFFYQIKEKVSANLCK